MCVCVCVCVCLYIYIVSGDFMSTFQDHSYSCKDRSDCVVLGGVKVKVPATGPKVRGLKPGRGRWVFKGDKIRSTISFGVEVKPSVPGGKTLRHVKEPLRHEKRY
jgi:hypothetical protein